MSPCRALKGWLISLIVMVLGITPGAWAATPVMPEGQQTLTTTLPNGLRVVIVRNPLAPVVTTVLNYLVGSNEAPPGFPGTAHAMEHMMFRGSPGLSADQLADISANMGGRFDADTQQTVTQYFFTVPSEDLDLSLHIEAIRMKALLGEERLWTQERGAIEQEVAQDLSNPTYVFYTKLLASMFRGTPYAHDPLGSKPSFDKTTDAALKNFHDTWYVPNNALLVIVGNVQPQQALAKVEQLFGPIPARPLPPRPAVRLEPVKPETLKITTDLPYGLGVLALRMPGYDSPDYPAVEVLSEALGSQRGDLYGLVPQGKALDAGFELSTLPKAGLAYAVAAYPSDGDGAGVVDEMKNVLSKAASAGIPVDLVEAAKHRAEASLEFQKNSVEGLAMAWSQAVAVQGRTSPEADVEAIRRVTPADVNRVARTYLDLDHAIVAQLVPHPSGKPISSKGFGGKESFAPKKTRSVALPEWAREALLKVDIPTSSIHPVATTLPNGIRLIVQPENVSNTVSVYGRIETNADLEAPKGQEGVQDVLGGLFSFGTTSRDRIALLSALDALGAEESAGPEFSLQILSDHFEDGLKLLSDNELHPALPADAFRIVRHQAQSELAGEMQSPDYLVQRALVTALFPAGDPSQRQATPATLGTLTLKDVQQYYQKAFRPDLTTIVVTGKITPEAATALVSKYFGDWKAVGPKPPTHLPPVPRNAQGVVHVPDESRVQDKVTLAETLDLNRFDPDYYALELGNHVLGGGFYATRLYRDLRENAGLVYFVSSSFDVGRTRSLYRVQYACDPQNVSKARAIVVHDLQDMQLSPVSDSELREAKAMLMREIPLGESSVSAIASRLLSYSITGLPLDEAIRAAHRYMELDAGQVRAAYAKWLALDRFVQLTEGPAPR